MYVPSSTYRLQLNKNFTFKDLKKQVSYLSSLGIGAVYASPLFQAVPGSNHGYDITSPLAFNKEIGTEEEFSELISRLKSLNIGWIQDIVPNHMAYHAENKWLMDVLKKGKKSEFAMFFDIDWEHPVFANKVMMPVLGKPLNQAISENEISLIQQGNEYHFTFADFTIPVSDESLRKFSNKAIVGADFCKKVNEDKLLLRKLLEIQHYVLTFWQEVDTALNYRRFFTINGLICLNMQKDEVFERYHHLILKMSEEEKFNGLRIDHIDGLNNPSTYLEKLRAGIGEDKYVVVEKILGQQEEFDKNWPVQGSTGYDYLAVSNNIFTNKESRSSLLKFYREIFPFNRSISDFIYQKKKQVLHKHFSGDLDNLFRMTTDSGIIKISSISELAGLKEALGEFLLCFPVYRLYPDRIPLISDDALLIKGVFLEARHRNPNLGPSLKVLENVFTGNHNVMENTRAAEIFRRMMQYTGPLMAKGVEDTAMYAWSGFIAHNEVGDSIEFSGITIADFHRIMKQRRKFLPASMNATATHDTKRGEDVRARLNVISDLEDEWFHFVRDSMKMNHQFKTKIRGVSIPDSNEEYFMYQTLLGAMPMDGKPDDDFAGRLTAYFHKALREAGIHSHWNNPDKTYEDALITFLLKILHYSEFLNQLEPVFEKLKVFGIINSLSQVVLKCTCPGMPDFFQGTEMWDLSLVDPDNRRAVDYPLRIKMIDDMKSEHKKDPENFFASLYRKKEDGRIKLWITHCLMAERAVDPAAFIKSSYIPLLVIGEMKNHILSFARSYQRTWYITIIPLHLAVIRNSDKSARLTDWKDMRIQLPTGAPHEWKNIWNNKEYIFTSDIRVTDIMEFDCPIVLKGKSVKKVRGSGILLHLSSLPGKYGIGGFGAEAFRFVDFLSMSGQSYWQILPFNPIDNSRSPYSSPSAFAGNPAFIDPDMLYRQHLLAEIPDKISESGSVKYQKALKVRESVVQDSYEHFLKNSYPLRRKKFQEFCNGNAYWLKDFALFSLLRAEFNNRSWSEWPRKFKMRDPGSLEKFYHKHEKDLEKLKFGQFIFNEQFQKLKTYAETAGIKIIGDISIYIGFESADVWSHPELFNLDRHMMMKTVAGVPPDFFSKTGQLWNMPVYNWKAMKEEGYGWWKNRIRRNLEFCDIVRLDHFRGYSAYWEVPAGDRNAVKGKWIKGPGHDFFSEIKREFPGMPLIAEDLGDIDDEVYKLRDRFELPGMRVMQFAFDENMPYSIHSPHMHSFHSIVYTGTHDNNTLRGWFKDNTGNTLKNRIEEYIGHKISEGSMTWEFIRMAYASVARIAIIPMQDILNMDGSARLNLPGGLKGNWSWKLKTGYDKPALSKKLLNLSALYGRI